MKKNLVKAIVLAVLGIVCIGRGLCSFRFDDGDYSDAGIFASAAKALKTEILWQVNNAAFELIAVGTLVLLSASKPWNEYRKEKAERDALYNVDEEE